MSDMRHRELSLYPILGSHYTLQPSMANHNNARKVSVQCARKINFETFACSRITRFPSILTINVNIWKLQVA
jgi:hypothetical protein